jgi:CRP-like cAMP-binding protein
VPKTTARPEASQDLAEIGPAATDHAWNGAAACPLADLCRGRTTQIKVAKGQTVFVPDQLARHVFLIHSGVVGGFQVWENGDETLQTVLMTGHLCGAEALVLKRRGEIPVRDYYARTFTPTTLCRMTMADFEATVQTDARLSLEIVQLMAERVHDLRRLLGFSYRGSSEKRLVALLLLLGQRTGQACPDGSLAIRERLSHQDLADLTGYNRPTVTKNLRALQSRHLIAVARREIRLLDPPALEALLR